jgi:TRAP-type C4-dicarboxylate transport system substrate-binding protein
MSIDAAKDVQPEDRKLVEAVAKRGQSKARKLIRKGNEDAKTTILRKGIVVVEPSKELVDQLTAIALTVRKELTGKLFTKEELDMVIGFRDEFRAAQKH